MTHITVCAETFPAKGKFVISRSALTHIDVVKVTIPDGIYQGRGECRPYARYDETPQSVIAQIEAVRNDIKSDMRPEQLLDIMPSGAARNAVDCALWDLRCKREGARIWELLGLPAPAPAQTAYTLSVAPPQDMARAALAANDFAILKLKIAGADGIEAVRAVNAARPDARLIIDPNEAIAATALPTFRGALAHLPIAMFEQPCPARDLTAFPTPESGAPMCADEAFHGDRSLKSLWDQGYRAVNIKLDKAGGLTQALRYITQARDHGFALMGGCMASTSLAVAPMAAISGQFDICDLDGPQLLSKDRGNPLRYDQGQVYPPEAELWG